MTPQKKFYEWKQEQGLPITGLDVTNGDTVQTLPTTPKTVLLRLAAQNRF